MPIVGLSRDVFLIPRCTSTTDHYALANGMTCREARCVAPVPVPKFGAFAFSCFSFYCACSPRARIAFGRDGDPQYGPPPADHAHGTTYNRRSRKLPCTNQPAFYIAVRPSPPYSPNPYRARPTIWLEMPLASMEIMAKSEVPT